MPIQFSNKQPLPKESYRGHEKTSLAQIRVLDHVIVTGYSGRNHQYAVMQVERVTATQLVIGDQRFMIRTGRRFGDGDRYNNTQNAYALSQVDNFGTPKTQYEVMMRRYLDGKVERAQEDLWKVMQTIPNRSTKLTEEYLIINMLFRPSGVKELILGLGLSQEEILSLNGRAIKVARGFDDLYDTLKNEGYFPQKEGV